MAKKKQVDIYHLIRSGASGEEVRAAIRRVLEDARSNMGDYMNVLSPLVMMKYIDAELLLMAIEKIMENGAGFEKADEIATAFERYYRSHAEEGRKLAVVLVAHDNGYVRYAGRQIWDRYGMSEFVHIGEMSEDAQVRIATSLLQGFMNPEPHLAYVLPLLNSKNADLRRVLVALLQHYVLNYNGIFKRIMDGIQLEDNEEVGELRSMCEDTEAHLNYAEQCKELWSEYAYPTELEICNRVVAEHMRAVSKKAEEDSKDNFFFTKMLKNVLLGRGGGMRMPNGTVRPLEKIEFTAQLPLYFAAFSPEEVNKWTDMIFADWSKIGKHE